MRLHAKVGGYNLNHSLIPRDNATHTNVMKVGVIRNEGVNDLAGHGHQFFMFIV